MQNKSKLGSCKWEFFFPSYIMLNISIIYKCFQYVRQLKNFEVKNVAWEQLGDAYLYQEPNFVLSFGVVAERRFQSLSLFPSLSSRHRFWLSTLYVSHIGPFPLAVAGCKIMSSCIQARPNSVRHKISYFQPAYFWLKEQLPISQQED